MQDLQVVGVESGSLVVVSEDGTRYRVPIDDALRAKLRQNVPEPGTAPRLSPREIQAQIRSGMSAQDVAGLTGAPLEYIQRFEGPVMAEREFVVQSAFGVPVRVAGDTGQLGEGRTFGTAIRERLHDIGAIGERWSSWKEEASGWVVKLSFTANHIDHDARWQFDHKKHSLVPLNTQAISLSHGEAAAPLQPRLRAVATGPADTSRFDSGAFAIDESEPPTPRRARRQAERDRTARRRARPRQPDRGPARGAAPPPRRARVGELRRRFPGGASVDGFDPHRRSSGRRPR